MDNEFIKAAIVWFITSLSKSEFPDKLIIAVELLFNDYLIFLLELCNIGFGISEPFFVILELQFLITKHTVYFLEPCFVIIDCLMM